MREARELCGAVTSTHFTRVTVAKVQILTGTQCTQASELCGAFISTRVAGGVLSALDLAAVRAAPGKSQWHPPH